MDDKSKIRKIIKTTLNEFLCEQFNNNEIKDLYSYADEYIDNYHSDGDVETIRDNIYNFIGNDFPFGLKNIPNKIKLYRVLEIKNPKKINKENLGKHYVGEKKVILNRDFLWSIGFGDLSKIFYLITIETNWDNIDFYRTIETKATYPDEWEYTLKNNEYNIIDIHQIKKGEDF